MISEVKPICLTGFGERVFGLQYRQGNLVEINKESREKIDE